MNFYTFATLKRKFINVQNIILIVSWYWNRIFNA